MTIRLKNVSPVKLISSVTAGGGLNLEYQGEDQEKQSLNGGDTPDTLMVERYKFTSVEVWILDCSETEHTLHAWTVNTDGTLTKWTRGTSSSTSGAVAEFDADVVVVAVPPGVAVPQSPPPAGPPAPGTTQKKIRVRIGQQGSLPLP